MAGVADHVHPTGQAVRAAPAEAVLREVEALDAHRHAVVLLEAHEELEEALLRQAAVTQAEANDAVVEALQGNCNRLHASRGDLVTGEVQHLDGVRLVRCQRSAEHLERRGRVEGGHVELGHGRVEADHVREHQEHILAALASADVHREEVCVVPERAHQRQHHFRILDLRAERQVQVVLVPRLDQLDQPYQVVAERRLEVAALRLVRLH
mmetsp:Transcript_15762/g.61577  ORF Transcript_15762/g.61577 Transcript_15762/m.61577 type:complete len:210 (+) Transcript_15762:1874-2503(+)